MNIIFLCASLEPGRDGVGDYTRRMAGEMIRQGNKAAIIAFNDRHFKKENEILRQLDLTSEITVLRLSNRLNWEKRTEIAKEFIDSTSPDWLSLQYVSYGFNDKGLPFRFIIQFKKICKKRELQIMFHETWIGAGADWKTKLTSGLQKMLANFMISYLRPNLIHTHLPCYQKDLTALGWNVDSLPLFSNIDAKELTQKVNEGNLLRIGFFSQVGMSEKISVFLKNLVQQVTAQGRNVEILLMGGKENRMRDFGNQLGFLVPFLIKIEYAGFMTPEKLTLALQSCDLGVSPVPRHALGKSGSAAAFIAHGVPVAAPNIHSKFKEEEIGFFSPGLRSAVLQEADLDKLIIAKQHALQARSEIQVSTITRIMLSDMQNSSYEKS